MADPLRIGDPAPWFTADCTSNPAFNVSTVAGRWLVLGFLGTSTLAVAQAALGAISRRRHLFDDQRVSFFGVSVDPADRTRLVESLPGIRFFRDDNLEVSRRYGAVTPDSVPGGSLGVRAFWMILDPMLRIHAVRPLAEAEALLDDIAALPDPDAHAGMPLTAPVLMLPRVFEPELCAHLVDLYETHGGEESGFMREVDGRTVAMLDHRHKRRSDFQITDEPLRATLRDRIIRRLVPEIRKAFQFEATRLERYIVACYDAGVGGYFRPHRDNTTKGTAHRRFAVTINLDAEAYDGGELRFPEFGQRTYRAPTGGAVVFSCSLLHEATPVTRGRRHAFLPFLYDDEGARIREANNPYLGEGLGPYRAG